MQKSDWSRRPLNLRQLSYADMDAVAALLLYEHQQNRNLSGVYQPGKSRNSLLQPGLGFDYPAENIEELPVLPREFTESTIVPVSEPSADLALFETALLGIITELPARYGPEQLAVSVGTHRIGLAGWIVDKTLGEETDFDEENSKLVIADLCERKLVKFTETRRLEATPDGAELWSKIKTY